MSNLEPITVRGKYGEAKIFAREVENDAVSQIITLLNQPMAEGAHVRVMPDVHAGKGCVIGYTARLTDYVVPNLIGVDIGCGVMAVPISLESLGLDVDNIENVDEFIENIKKLDAVLKARIPNEQNVNTGFSEDTIRKLYDRLPEELRPKVDVEEFIPKLREVSKRTRQKYDYVVNSLRSLGGGNHFIELGVGLLNGEPVALLTVHTGSRNFGLKVANYWQGIAEKRMGFPHEEFEERKREIIERYRKTNPRMIQKELQKLKEELKSRKVPKGLEYLTGEDREGYLHDMQVAQTFANLNRAFILDEAIRESGLRTLGRGILSVHNYVDFEDGVVRKGAIAAREGEYVVVPLNMRDGIVIGIGKGNPEWNYSAPHGAGRRMSRSQAKRQIPVEEFRKVMQESGVASSCVNETTLDEAPMAYKDVNEVLDFVGETIDVVGRVLPVYNFKGGRHAEIEIPVEPLVEKLRSVIPAEADVGVEIEK